MPTAAKLIAGLGFAITAMIAGLFYFANLEATSFTITELLLFCAVVGFGMGWFVLGPFPGYGGWDSIYCGLRAGLVAVLLTSVIFGLMVVGKAVVGGNYLDPMLPFYDVVRYAGDFLWDLYNKAVLISLALGATLTSRLAGVAYVRWL